jgi:hypothetical protein
MRAEGTPMTGSELEAALARRERELEERGQKQRAELELLLGAGGGAAAAAPAAPAAAPASEGQINISTTSPLTPDATCTISLLGSSEKPVCQNRHGGGLNFYVPRDALQASVSLRWKVDGHTEDKSWRFHQRATHTDWRNERHTAEASTWPSNSGDKLANLTLDISHFTAHQLQTNLHGLRHGLATLDHAATQHALNMASHETRLAEITFRGVIYNSDHAVSLEDTRKLYMTANRVCKLKQSNSDFQHATIDSLNIAHLLQFITESKDAWRQAVRRGAEVWYSENLKVLINHMREIDDVQLREIELDATSNEYVCTQKAELERQLTACVSKCTEVKDSYPSDATESKCNEKIATLEMLLAQLPAASTIRQILPIARGFQEVKNGLNQLITQNQPAEMPVFRSLSAYSGDPGPQVPRCDLMLQDNPFAEEEFVLPGAHAVATARQGDLAPADTAEMRQLKKTEGKGGICSISLFAITRKQYEDMINPVANCNSADRF